MTNQSMRATFGSAYFDHKLPEDVNPLAIMTWGSLEAEKKMFGLCDDLLIKWGKRCGYEALRETAYDLKRHEQYGTR